MAGPIKPEADRKSAFIRVRITLAQQEALLKMARQLDCRPGDLVRRKVFDEHSPRPKLERVDHATYMELKKIGVNINQLAWHANVGRFPYGIREELGELKRQEAMLLRLLLRE